MATIELRKLISRNRNYGSAQKYPLSVINLLFQYVYGLFIMKSITEWYILILNIEI